MADVQGALAKALPQDSLAPASELRHYAVDGVTPQAVVLLASIEQLASALALANEQGWAVAVRGSGSLADYGGVPKRIDVVLSLERMPAAIDHAPGDMTVTASAATTLSALQETLGKAGQWLPVDPPLAAKRTLGGVLATNLTGPLGQAYGGLRDMVIGMKVMGPDGVVAKSGGNVVKNVTGFDIHKTHTGALGTLGVILEASLKVQPLPKKDMTMAALFPDMRQAITASLEALAQPWGPQALEVGLIGLNRRGEDGGILPPLCNVYSRFMGSEQGLERRLASYEQAVERLGGQARMAGGHMAAQTWQWLADFGWDADAGVGLLVRLGCLPSSVGELATGVEEIARGGEHQASLVVGPGRGVVKAFFPGLKWGDAAIASKAVEALRGLAAGVQGYAVVERCPLPAKTTLDVWGDPGSGLPLMQKLKQQMDPKGILNLGRFVGGI